jgi:uncharacterized protein YbjT (DUF2867 family)
MLGKRLVPVLVNSDHEVRIFSRHAQGDGRVHAVQGDVREREQLAPAVKDVDVVIHAATNPRRGAHRVEVEGTRNVADVAAEFGAHVVYVSIVGVDRHRLPYYKAKWEAEQTLERSRCRWTIQRATQFHDLLNMFLDLPVFIRTPHLAFQVVDAGEVAQRLVTLAEGPPQGRVADFGGPEVVPIRALAETRRAITGRRARLLRVPRIGFVADFDAGRHLCPDHCEGQITWQDWLQATATG